MAGYQDIDSSGLRTLLSSHKVLLIDVRNDDETSRGIIPGASCIPLHLLPTRADELHGKDLLVFYCHSGIRSAQAAGFMANLGHENIYNLRGGILSWGSAGFAFDQKR